jgi:transcriptional regulator of heat shock response
MAALRDPRLKNRDCTIREDSRHHTIAWLSDAIRVEFPAKNAGIMQVSATQPDREDAAAMVNAVVAAYMAEVVDNDRQQRREHLSNLQQISAEKENEVRTKREQLKRELENIGIGDEQTLAVRTQLAMSMYLDFQRQFQAMRWEHRTQLGKLQAAKRTLADLPTFEIPEIQVATLLNNNPAYHDLQSRLALLEANRLQAGDAAPGMKASPAVVRNAADLETTKAQLQSLDQQTRDQIRGALRIELENEVHRLECQVEISIGQLTSFEKEVEKKSQEATDIGRSSVYAQMARTEVENIERILNGVAAERETLRVELKAANRVKVLGDSYSPAAVPENPD